MRENGRKKLESKCERQQEVFQEPPEGHGQGVRLEGRLVGRNHGSMGKAGLNCLKNRMVI